MTSDGGRVELGDDEFQIHPAFRPALRATRGTITATFEPARLRGVVRGSVDNKSPGGGLRRGTAEYQLLVRSRTAVLRMIHDAEHPSLPREVHQEVAASLRRVMRHIDELAIARLTDEQMIEQVEYTRLFLRGIAQRLEADGFAEHDPFLTRAIDDVVRALRFGIRGETYTFGGGSGS